MNDDNSIFCSLAMVEIFRQKNHKFGSEWDVFYVTTRTTKKNQNHNFGLKCNVF